MDFTEMSDSELDGLRIAVLTEQERRRTVETAAEQAQHLADRYASAIGRTDGDQWVQPTGAHDAYALGATVAHDEKVWESLTPANVWEPGQSGWREVIENGGPPAWVAPTGAHDSYQTGDQVTHDGHTWTSNADNNVWKPGEYGWTQIN